MNGARTLHAQHLILDSETVLGPGWVSVEGARIAEIGEGEAPRELDAIRGGEESVLAPGMVTTHSHLCLGNLRHLADDREFLPWILHGVIPAMEQVGSDRTQWIAGAKRSISELLRGGVTTIAENFLHQEGGEQLAAQSIPGRFYQEVFGSLADDLDTYLSEQRLIWSERLLNSGSLSDAGLAPHTPWSCPPKVMIEASLWAKKHQRSLSIHLEESREEREFFLHKRGDIAEITRRHGRLDRYELGTSATKMLARLGVLGPHVLAVHGVQMDSEDLQVLAEHDVSVAHCPVSNMKLALGIAPVLEMLEHGIRVSLGVDSAASSNSLSMFSEMRAFLLGQRARYGRVGMLTARQAFALATENGARALGLGDEVGRIAPGMRANLMMAKLDGMGHGPQGDAISKLVWTGTASDVVYTMIDGALVWERPS